MEEYYLAKKVKNEFFIDAFNIDILKRTGNSLEMLSSKVIKPKEHGIKIDKNNVVCTNDEYELKKIDEIKARETLREMGVNYSSWENYMSTSDNVASSQLNNPSDSLI